MFRDLNLKLVCPQDENTSRVDDKSTEGVGNNLLIKNKRDVPKTANNNFRKSRRVIFVIQRKLTL